MTSEQDELRVGSWVRAHVNAALELRDYQLDVWEELWRMRASTTQQRALVSLATGLGKTSVAAVDVLHYLRAENIRGRVLFVSHMTDISSQARRTFTSIDGTLKTTLFTSRTLSTLNSYNVVFATFQALYRCLDQLDSQQFDYIIWDEAHHIEAATFSQVRNHFTPKFQLGLTATPERADGLDIFAYFGQPLYVKSLAEGMAEGWLSAVDYHIMLDDTVKAAMQKKFDFKTTREIRNLFAIRARNEVIAKNVMERRHAIGLDKAKTIVFCQNVAMAESMATLLSGEAYHSDLHPNIRSDMLKRFRTGHLQVITTVDMFNEGIDIPDARLVVFLRSTSSRTIFEQQLGRGLRRSAEKNTVTVLDFVANVERIDFVRELGHTVTRIRAERGINASSTGGSSPLGSAQIEHAHFTLTNFEFEDQTIEILDRYNALKQAYHLTPEIVAAEFAEIGNVAEIAKKHSVSTTAIYKHLKRAGIAVNNMTPEYDIEEIARVYYEAGSSKKAALQLGINPSTILDRLKRAGYKTIPPAKLRFTDEELVAAFEKCGRHQRKTAAYLQADRAMLSRRLKAIGYDMSRKPKVSMEALAAAYTATNGDLVSLTDTLRSKTGCGYVDIYRALDRYGYLDNQPRPITTAIAAAAYYKFHNSVAAGKHLGVSGALVSRKAKGAYYINKYKQVKEDK